MNMEKSLSMEAVRDFACDGPNLLIIAANPTTDELMVTYGGKVMYGRFDEGVIARAVTEEGFKGAWKQFSEGLLSVLGTDNHRGAKLVNGVLDALQSIGESLSVKQDQHGKGKGKVRVSGNASRGKGGRRARTD